VLEGLRGAESIAELSRREGIATSLVASSTGATGKAIPAEGGYRITGRWPFASGAPHATTLAAVCEVDEVRCP
jgi:alkylation response protein AidB-like acyl-CoA dehydrogenase